MQAFDYRHGRLFAEDVDLDALAAEVGTPAYVYSAGFMRARLGRLLRAFATERALVCYAIKANHHLAVIRTLSQAGAGADTVSGGEIKRARAAGVPPERIVFAGVAKADDEIRLALGEGILQFNVESSPELIRIAELATAMGKTAPVALRINPDVAAATHDKISTGRKSDKFGVPLGEAAALFRLAAELPGIEPVGLHLHIGSQITTLGPYETAYGRAFELFRALRAEGLPLRRVDLGGGLGVRYGDETPPEPEAFAAMIRPMVQGLDVELVLEPGRWLVADAGLLLASVIYLKEGADRRFLVLDTGMNTLLRPAMYGARHPIEPVRRPGPEERQEPMDVVGPICESSDIFGRDYVLPLLKPQAKVAIRMAGAYGVVMSSTYNSRPGPAEIMVDGDRWAIIRPRIEPEQQFANERIPGWLLQP